MYNAEEQLLNIQDTDYVTKKKLYEIMGDGCVAVKNYKKALEYYRKMLEVCPEVSVAQCIYSVTLMIFWMLDSLYGSTVGSWPWLTLWHWN